MSPCKDNPEYKLVFMTTLHLLGVCFLLFIRLQNKQTTITDNFEVQLLAESLISLIAM